MKSKKMILVFCFSMLISKQFFAQTDKCSIESYYNGKSYTFKNTLKLDSKVKSFRVHLRRTKGNCNVYKTEAEGSGDKWLSYSLEEGNLYISVKENKLPYERTYYFEFEIDGMAAGQLSIEQAPSPQNKYYYKDSDRDGFGDYNAPKELFSSKPPNYSTNNYDYCPHEPSSNHNGCLESYENRNWLRSQTFNIKKELIGSSKGYYNTLGKVEQTQSYDVKHKRIWATETRYDVQGRPALQTLSAPITAKNTSESFKYKEDFIQNSSNNNFTQTDFEGKGTEPSKVGKKTNTLGAYYSDANTTEPFQDKTDRPYSRTIFSTLQPGAVKQVIGGNKQNGAWRQGYTFSMPAAQEMYYVFGYNYFPSKPKIKETYTGITSVVNANDKQITWLKAGKTVVKDVNGNESVVFTDVDGKTLAAARSGGAKKYEVLSLIGTQKFVDIHIPKGCDDTLQFIGNKSNYKVYDLKTEQPYSTTPTTLKAGFYRIEYIGNIELTKSHNLAYIDKSVTTSINKIKPVHTTNAVGVRYMVNYYDYSINYYNDTGQLTKSYQPLGFNPTCLEKLKDEVVHDGNLKSTFKYNALGQLLKTKSPDEGEAEFKYRKDGQIRFSQNSKQKLVNEFSYTNYDRLARPIESGVCSGTFTSLNGDGTNSFTGIRKEQHFTEYDYLTTSAKNRLRNIAPNYQNPTFLSGNVVHTFNKEGNQTVSETFYSYDIYGRVQWIVQYIDGLGNRAKTINYEYDPVTSQVLKVLYQKGTSEQFIHRYTYDSDTQQLVKVETSTNNRNFITHADYKYYETGALKRTELAGGIQGIDYVYNLAGQLKSINHPNLTSNKDPGGDSTDLFGLTLDYYSGDYQRKNDFSFSNSQYNQYNGNIKAITWNTKINSAITNPLRYEYKYNKNNWLQEARFFGTGTGQTTPETNITLNSQVHTTQYKVATNSIVLKPGFSVKASSTLRFSAKINNNTSGNYATEDYLVSGITYDANGNIKTLNRNKNTEAGIGNAMDKLTYKYKENNKSNRLDRVKDAVTTRTNADDIKTQSANNYRYNDIGQLTRNEGEKVNYEYNASGLVTLVKYNNQPKVRFYYNDKGFRTKKVTYASNGTSIQKTTHYVRDASGSVLAIYENQQQKELPIYGANRLGVYNKSTSTSVYQLTDHLGNVRAVIAKQGNNAVALTSATDYYPFGMPMPNRQIVNGKPYRYAYQGQEKDPETGKEAFQLRLWDARIGRWLNPDPYRQYHSPYNGMGNDPINGIDPDGGWKTKWGRFWAWVNYGFQGKFWNTPDASDSNRRYGIIQPMDDEAGFNIYYTHNGWVKANLNQWDREIISDGLVDINSKTLGRDLSSVKMRQFNQAQSQAIREHIKPAVETYAKLRMFGGSPVGAPTNVVTKSVSAVSKSEKLLEALEGSYNRVSYIKRPSDIAVGAPNSIYDYVTSEGKQLARYFYDDAGKLIYEINYKAHNMGGVHGHRMSTPGNIRSGHTRENHIPFMFIPAKYLK